MAERFTDSLAIDNLANNKSATVILAVQHLGSTTLWQHNILATDNRRKKSLPLLMCQKIWCGKKSGWQNVWVAKFLFFVKCQNVWVAKCRSAKMLQCQNVVLPKCCVAKMLCCQNVVLPNCRAAIMSCCQNVVLPK